MGLEWSLPSRRVCRAIESEDVERLRQICRENQLALMTVRSSAKSRTLVLFASEKGSAAALEVVLDACREAARGPQEFRDHINVPDRKGNGPLALAARAGKPANVGLLLMRGADPLHRNRVGDSAVHLAAQSGCAQSLGLLLSARGAGGVGTVAATIVHSRHSVERYVDAPNDSGLAPLHVACLHGNLAAVNALILHGAALDAPVLGVSRRVVAAAAAHHRRRGATAGAAGLAAGATPLHIAAAAGDAAACIALLDAARRRGGRGPAAELRRARNVAGLTPLVCALMAGHFGLARLLVQSGGAGPDGGPGPRPARIGGALGPSARTRLAELLHRVQLLLQLRALAAAEQARARRGRRARQLRREAELNEWADPALAIYGLGRDPAADLQGPKGALLRAPWLAAAQPGDVARCAKLLGLPRSNLRDALNAFVRLLAAKGPAAGAASESGSEADADEAAAGAVVGGPPSPRHSGTAGALEHWLSRLSGGTVARRARRARRRVAAAYAASRGAPSRGRGLTRDRMGPLDTGSLGMSAARGLGSLQAPAAARQSGGALVVATLLGRSTPSAPAAAADETAILSALLDYLVTKNPAPLLLPELRSVLAQEAAAGAAPAARPGAATTAMLALEPARDDASDADSDALADKTRLGECSICMDAAADARIPACGHSLCVACAVQLVAAYVERPTCPFCRCDIEALEAAEGPGADAAGALPGDGAAVLSKHCGPSTVEDDVAVVLPPV